MTDLTPYLGDPLIALIDKVILDEEASQPVRNYIGASGINGDCDRMIWLQYQGHKSVFNADALRRMNDGKVTESTVIKWLEKIPSLELYHTKPDGTQYGFSDLGGKYKGHYDGIIRGIPQSPNTWHILEIKCVQQSDFGKIKKLIEKHGEENTLSEWSPRYYGQAVTYMWYEKLARHLTIVASAGGRELLTIRTHQNHTFAKQLRDKAERLINMQTPPERIGDSTYYKCRYCGLRDICQR